MTHYTLEEIGKKAGVSRSTVSRVINNQPNVSEKVRARVLQIIDKTGFQPNLAARSLASSHTRVIGLVIPRSVHTLFTDPYFSLLTEGVSQACNQWDYTLALFIMHNREEERRLLPRISRPGFLDGLIIQATTLDDPLISSLDRGRIPFVVAGRPEDLPDANFVDVDNVGGAYSAVHHLAQLGYSRIGTITGALSTNAGRDRREGYYKALAAHGLVPYENLIVEGDFTEMSGYYAGLKVLQANPDAVFVASDIMAVGLLRAARELGIRVPEDLGLVSYDDVPSSQFASPALTTVRQPIIEFGQKAFEILLDRLENGSRVSRQFIFDTELIVRKSCGAELRERIS